MIEEYPIWWGNATWLVDGFIEVNDFTGKTVIAFCTSSSSDLGESGDSTGEAAAEPKSGHMTTKEPMGERNYPHHWLLFYGNSKTGQCDNDHNGLVLSNLTGRWKSLSSLQKLPIVNMEPSDIRQFLIFDKIKGLF